MNTAKAVGNLTGCLDAAGYALKIGKLDLFYQACKAAWEIDPNDDRVKKLVELELAIDKPVAYYRELGKLPKANQVTTADLQRVFDKVFGEDKQALNGEWRAYMRSLKTDLEKTLEDAR